MKEKKSIKKERKRQTNRQADRETDRQKRIMSIDRRSFLTEP